MEVFGVRTVKFRVRTKNVLGMYPMEPYIWLGRLPRPEVGVDAEVG